MRKLMALAIVLATASWSSRAFFGLEDVSFDGSLEVNGNSANNEDSFSSANDHRGTTNTRVRLGMNAKVTEGVDSRLELVRADLGDGENMYGGGGGATSVDDETGNFLFHNAYVELGDLWGTNMRLGRQYVGESNDLVWHIGPKSDDALRVTSIDGLRVKCAEKEGKGIWDKIRLILFTGKQSEVNTSVAGVTQGDVNLSNLELNVVNVIPDGRIRVAYLIGKDENTAVTSDNNKLNILRLGADGGLMEKRLTYRAELLMNTGELGTTDYEGSAIDLGVGFNTGETGAGTFGLAFNWVNASGDDNSTDSKDESFHDFSTFGGGNTSDRYFGEIFGKSNAMGGGTPIGQGLDTGFNGQGMQVLNLGVTYKPSFAPKTWAKLDFFNIAQAEDTLNGADVGDEFGTEFDLTLGYTHSDNVLLEGGYAMLSPEEALTGVGATDDEDVTKFFARASIKWGGEAQ